MYGRENYIQYPVINHNGREQKVECIYVHNWVTLLYSSNWQNIIINYVCVLVVQSCPTLCDLMDYSLPGSSVHGLLQARILDWVAMPVSRGCSQFSNSKKLKKKKKKIKRDFSGGLVAKTPHSQCRGANFHPVNYKLALAKSICQQLNNKTKAFAICLCGGWACAAASVDL